MELVQRETKERPIYSLGLGEKLPEVRTGKIKSEQDEEYLFMQREKEREMELELKERKKNEPVQKKTTNGRPNREGTIRRLYESAMNYATDRKTLTLPAIDAKRTYGKNEEILAITSMESQELDLYRDKSKQIALPKSRQIERKDEGDADFDFDKEYKPKELTIGKGEKREPVKDFILHTRNILLSKIAMQDKEKEAKRMAEYIERKESILKLNKEIYEQDKEMLNRYVNLIKTDAEKKKHSADEKAKIRQQKEIELEELKKKKTEINKRITEGKNTCTEQIEFKNFIYSLNPHIKKEIEARKKERAKKSKTFMTQQQDAEANAKDADLIKQLQVHTDVARHAREAFKELHDELELSENDSDTEIPTGFKDVSEILELMHAKEQKNCSIIEQAQDIEKRLDDLKKENNNKIASKNEELRNTEKAQEEMLEKKKKKEELLNELIDRAGQNEVERASITDYYKKLETTITELKATLKAEVTKLFNLKSGKQEKGTKPERAQKAEKEEKDAKGRKQKKEAKSEKKPKQERPITQEKANKLDKDAGNDIKKQTLDMLNKIAQYVIDFKMSRECKILKTKREGTNNEFQKLVAEEKKKVESWRKKLASEARENDEFEKEKKRKEKVDRKNKDRVKLDPKEMVRKKMLQVKETKKVDKNAKKVEDPFHGKYFDD